MAVIAFPCLVLATDRTWDNGAADSDWSSPANWTGDAEPDAGSGWVYIGNSDTAYVEITQTGEACQNLIVGYNNASVGTLRILDGALTVTNSSKSGSVNLGHLAGSIGVVTQELGQIDANIFRIGRNGSGTFVQYGGTNKVTSFSFGIYGGSTGSYRLHDGAVQVSSTMTIGSAADSDGELVMDGGELSVGSWLTSGGSGLGEYRQNGGTATAAGLKCGDVSTGVGHMVLASNAVLKILPGDTYIGEEGFGRLEIRDGATLFCDGLHFNAGWKAGSTGVLFIAGGFITNAAGTYTSLGYYAGAMGIVTQSAGLIQTLDSSFYVGPWAGMAPGTMSRAVERIDAH